MRIDAALLAAEVSHFDPLTLGIVPGSAVIVDCETVPNEVRAETTARVESWLARLPCPSIAIASEAMPAGFDLCVTRPDELERAESAIAANPVAATVLVQTLRLIDSLPAQAGLVVESLAFAALQQGAEFRRWLAGRPPEHAPGVNDDPILLVEEHEDGQRLSVLLNRPSTRNAVDTKLRDALFDLFARVALDSGVRTVELRGSGDSFSVGGALGEFGRVRDGAEGHMIRLERLPARMLVDHGARYHFHLHGACVGAGVEMAAFGGRVTATRSTFVRLPEVAMGLIPGAGGCVSITRRIGRQRAVWLMLTGQRIGARTALKWGLIDAIES